MTRVDQAWRRTAGPCWRLGSWGACWAGTSAAAAPPAVTAALRVLYLGGRCAACAYSGLEGVGRIGAGYRFGAVSAELS
jgi:hypothetical protein